MSHLTLPSFIGTGYSTTCLEESLCCSHLQEGRWFITRKLLSNISYMCRLCRTLKHIISTNIHTHLNRYNILTDHQHGFRSGRSCETQLMIGIINDFVGILNDLGQIDAIFLDMSKAFDTVPLQRLCCKLSHYGISGYTLKWIESLLTGRFQQVVVNGEYSDPITVISRVPQGSVLGPLLFLCYIYDKRKTSHLKCGYMLMKPLFIVIF